MGGRVKASAGTAHRVRALDLVDDVVPEPDRFGVGCPRGRSARRGPSSSAGCAGPRSDLGIAVEPQRIDVLVLLGWVLGVGDGAVGADREPWLAGSGPWVVGRPAVRSPARPPSPDPWCARRRRRSRRSCPDPDGPRRDHREEPMAHGDPGSSGPGSGCCWVPAVHSADRVDGGRATTSKPIAAIAGSRFCASANVPLRGGSSSAPSLGKSSYQEPNSARRRSA